MSCLVMPRINLAEPMRTLASCAPLPSTKLGIFKTKTFNLSMSIRVLAISEHGGALALTDDLIKNAPTPAATLGSKGGSVTPPDGREAYDTRRGQT